MNEESNSTPDIPTEIKRYIGAFNCDIEEMSPIMVKILLVLYEKKCMEYQELSDILNTPLSTLHDTILKLLSFNMLKKYQRYTGKLGRPFVKLMLNWGYINSNDLNRDHRN